MSSFQSEAALADGAVTQCEGTGLKLNRTLQHSCSVNKLIKRSTVLLERKASVIFSLLSIHET